MVLALEMRLGRPTFLFGLLLTKETSKAITAPLLYKIIQQARDEREGKISRERQREREREGFEIRGKERVRFKRER